MLIAPDEGFPWEKVDAAKRYLSAVKPWWGRFLKHFIIVPVEVMPADESVLPFGSTTATDRDFRIYIDRLFALSVPLHYLAGAIEHELQRHTRDTWQRFKFLKNEAWREEAVPALDLEINSTIDREQKQLTMEQIFGICQDSVIFTTRDIDYWGVTSAPGFDDDGWIPRVLGMDDGLSAEQYHQIMKKALEDPPPPEEDEGDDSEDEGDEDESSDDTEQEASEDSSQSEDGGEEGESSEDSDVEEPDTDENADDEDDSNESDSEQDAEDEQQGSGDNQEDEDGSEDGEEGGLDNGGEPSDNEEEGTEGTEGTESEQQQESNDANDSGESSGEQDTSEGSPSDQLGGQEQAQAIKDLQASEIGKMWQNSIENPNDPIDHPAWKPSDELPEYELPDKPTQTDISAAFEELSEDIGDFEDMLENISGTYGDEIGSNLFAWREDYRKARGLNWDRRFQKLANALLSSTQIKGQSDLSYSVRNPNQAAIGPILQGLLSYSPTIYVIQDVSGSMHAGKMARSMSVFTDLCKKILSNYGDKVTWFSADTAMRDVGKTSRWNEDVRQAWSFGFGGTNGFGMLIDQIMRGKLVFKGKRYPKPDLLIASTDCLFPWSDTRPKSSAKLLVINVGDLEDAEFYLPDWLDRKREFVQVD